MSRREGRTQDRTYQNHSADKHQIPNQVLLLGEPWIANFQLAQVMIEEVCVEEHVQPAAGNEKRGHGAPYFRWKLEQEHMVKDEVLEWQDSEVDAKRQDSSGGGDRPFKAVSCSSRHGNCAQQTHLETGGAWKKPSITVSMVESRAFDERRFGKLICCRVANDVAGMRKGQRMSGNERIGAICSFLREVPVLSASRLRQSAMVGLTSPLLVSWPLC